MTTAGISKRDHQAYRNDFEDYGNAVTMQSTNQKSAGIDRFNH
jgi:hypothetical protein